MKIKPKNIFPIMLFLVSGIFCLLLGIDALNSGEAKYRSTVFFSESPFEYVVVVVIQLSVGLASIYLAYREGQK